jgi:hypothetical protein
MGRSGTQGGFMGHLGAKRDALLPGASGRSHARSLPPRDPDLSARHRRRLTGRTRTAVGRFPAGTGYRAEDPQLALWVHATLVWTALELYDGLVAPLPHQRRARYQAARFGHDGAHGEWFYGFRLAVKTDLGSRLVRAWSIVPAAVNERDVAEDLLQAGPPPREVLPDKGFAGRAFTAACAARGTAVLTPPTKAQRPTMPSALRTVIACWRNYIEVTFGELTDRMELARHGAVRVRPHV